MKRMAHMRTTSKANYVQSRMRGRGYVCVSKDWVKWAKKYLNRNSRRKMGAFCLEIEETI